jgi:hypothetical protein
VENSNINLKNKIKLRTYSETISNLPKILKKNYIQIEKCKKCKNLISSRLSLEYIMKQFYIIENYFKNFVDETEICKRDFLFDPAQKIPYENFSLPMMNDKMDSGKYLANLESNLAGGHDKSQFALQSSTLNKLQLN